MSTKHFCDYCQKELKEKEITLYFYHNVSPKGINSFSFCAECFRQHWRGKLPQKEDK